MRGDADARWNDACDDVVRAPRMDGTIPCDALVRCAGRMRACGACGNDAMRAVRRYSGVAVRNVLIAMRCDAMRVRAR
jgi:hypothetical protein